MHKKQYVSLTCGCFQHCRQFWRVHTERGSRQMMVLELLAFFLFDSLWPFSLPSCFHSCTVAEKCFIYWLKQSIHCLPTRPRTSDTHICHCWWGCITLPCHSTDKSAKCENKWRQNCLKTQWINSRDFHYFLDCCSGKFCKATKSNIPFVSLH